MKRRPFDILTKKKKKYRENVFILDDNVNVFILVLITEMIILINQFPEFVGIKTENQA